MLDVGFSEILLFGIVALVVLGPEKLPQAIRTAGRWYAKIRSLINNVQRDIEQELQLAEMREQMQKELARIKSIEQEMQSQLDQMQENLADLNHSIHPGVAEKDSPAATPEQVFRPAPAFYSNKLLHPFPSSTSNGLRKLADDSFAN